jgi:gamma-glutamyltranspeptidase
MSPTIVLKDGRVAMIAGGSGGPRIISATTQCLLNVMMFHMSPQDAVSKPRFHHQWMPNVLQFDKRWIDQAVIEQIQARGHETGELKNESAVQMIVTHGRDGAIRAACDPRKGGRPAGY